MDAQSPHIININRDIPALLQRQNPIQRDLDPILPQEERIIIGFFLAAQAGDADEIGKLLKKFTINQNIRYPNGDTPLTIACRNPVKLTDALIQRSTEMRPINATGQQALEWAQRTNCLYWHLGIMQASTIANNHPEDPPAIVFKWSIDHISVVDQLIEHGIDISAANHNGDTPLIYAALSGNSDLVAMLLSNGANINTPNIAGDTALSCAVHRGHIEIVRLLLESGAAINAANTEGITPLMYAVLHRHTEIVRLVLEIGADINATTITQRNTALIYAANNGDIEIIRLVLESEAPIDCENSAGNTAADLAYAQDNQILNLIFEFKIKSVNTKNQNSGHNLITVGDATLNPKIAVHSLKQTESLTKTGPSNDTDKNTMRDPHSSVPQSPSRFSWRGVLGILRYLRELILELWTKCTSFLTPQVYSAQYTHKTDNSSRCANPQNLDQNHPSQTSTASVAYSPKEHCTTRSRFLRETAR